MRHRVPSRFNWILHQLCPQVVFKVVLGTILNVQVLDWLNGSFETMKKRMKQTYKAHRNQRRRERLGRKEKQEENVKCCQVLQHRSPVVHSATECCCRYSFLNEGRTLPQHSRPRNASRSIISSRSSASRRLIIVPSTGCRHKGSIHLFVSLPHVFAGRNSNHMFLKPEEIKIELAD